MAYHIYYSNTDGNWRLRFDAKPWTTGNANLSILVDGVAQTFSGCSAINYVNSTTYMLLFFESSTIIYRDKWNGSAWVQDGTSWNANANVGSNHYRQSSSLGTTDGIITDFRFRNSSNVSTDCDIPIFTDTTDYTDFLHNGITIYTSNGGGATHIAKVTGQLKDLSSNLSDILMVSGGGGGGLLVGDTDYSGKEAGGISGSGDNSADQSTGNAFGQGESGTNVSGGGSGLYGGYKGVITSKTPVEPFSKYVLSTYANSGTPSARNLTPMQYSSDGTSFLNNLSDTGSIFQMSNTYISSLSNINYTPRNVAGYSNVGGYLPSGAKYQFTTTSSAIQFDFYDKNGTNVYTCEYSKTDSNSVYLGFFKNDNDIAGLILYQENQSEATVIIKGNSTYYDMFMSIANVDGSSTPQLTKGGGAGSGYIGNSLLSNKKMVGYNVPTSSAEGTKTESVNYVSASPVSGKPKSGNGFARIKFLRDWEGDEEMNYSKSEHLVGTWIDGSNLYEKTFEFLNVAYIQNGQTYNCDLTNIQCIYIHGVIYENNNAYPIGWSGNATLGAFYTTNGEFGIKAGDSFQNADMYLTIRYIKL